MEKLVHDLVSEQFIRSLKAMKKILEKSENFAKERNFSSNLFLDTKLAPDMFNFTRQIQISTDIAKGAVARLSGKTAPVFKDEEKSLPELVNRIDQTLEFIASFKAQDFKDFASKEVTFPWVPGKKLSGNDFLVSHALPNFYFHMTTAYNLLRSSGVKIGKVDFLGEQNWVNV